MFPFEVRAMKYCVKKGRKRAKSKKQTNWFLVKNIFTDFLNPRKWTLFGILTLFPIIFLYFVSRCLRKLLYLTTNVPEFLGGLDC